MNSLYKFSTKLYCILVEIVVVGTGEKIIRLPPEINNYMKKHNILLEVQDTVSSFIHVIN